MLNIFPIQYLALFAYFILRVVTSSILLHLGLQHWRYRRELKAVFTTRWLPISGVAAYVFPIAELVIAGFLLVGAYTQIAALLIIIMSLKLIIVRPWFAHPSIPSRLFYTLLFAVALSLFITGAGAFAFDLPI